MRYIIIFGLFINYVNAIEFDTLLISNDKKQVFIWIEDNSKGHTFITTEENFNQNNLIDFNINLHNKNYKLVPILFNNFLSGNCYIYDVDNEQDKSLGKFFIYDFKDLQVNNLNKATIINIWKNNIENVNNAIKFDDLFYDHLFSVFETVMNNYKKLQKVKKEQALVKSIDIIKMNLNNVSNQIEELKDKKTWHQKNLENLKYSIYPMIVALIIALVFYLLPSLSY